MQIAHTEQRQCTARFQTIMCATSDQLSPSITDSFCSFINPSVPEWSISRNNLVNKFSFVRLLRLIIDFPLIFQFRKTFLWLAFPCHFQVISYQSYGEEVSNTPEGRPNMKEGQHLTMQIHANTNKSTGFIHKQRNCQSYWESTSLWTQNTS